MVNIKVSDVSIRAIQNDIESGRIPAPNFEYFASMTVITSFRLVVQASLKYLVRFFIRQCILVKAPFAVLRISVSKTLSS